MVIAFSIILMFSQISFAKEKTKSILEYYSKLPISKEFPIILRNGKYCTKSPVRPGPEEVDVLVDVQNGYIQFSINGWGHGDDYQAALFLDKDNHAYVAINTTGKESPAGFVSYSCLNIYEFRDTTFTDVTAVIFPAITKSMFTHRSHDYSKLVDPHSKIEPVQFTLPRYSTDIISQLSSRDFVEAIYQSRENKDLLEKFFSDITYKKIQIKWDRNKSRFTIGNKLK